ncbi:MAG: hypothetical protein ABFE16_14440 [Armatimonadia bacterium]
MECVRTVGVLSVALLLWAAVAGCAADYEVTGIGGAGGMYTPMACPSDPDLMLLSCDMSGAYRSLDGGKHWELIHCSQLNNSLGCYPLFLKDAILWVSGGTLKISRDKAATWQAVVQPSPWVGGISYMAALEPEGRPPVLFVAAKDGVWRSPEGGKTWERVIEGDCRNLLAVGSRVYAVCVQKTLVSADQGKTWEEITAPELKGHQVFGLGGSADKDGKVCLYASAWGVGVLKSLDEGKTWQVLLDKYDDQNVFMVPAGQIQIAYMAQSGGGWCRRIWRTRDQGQTWDECFFMSGPKANVELAWVQTQLKWGYYITPRGFGMCAGDPNLVLVSTQGDLYLSRDGGGTWHQIMNLPVEITEDGKQVRGYRSNGCEVTTCMRYLIHPQEPRRRYILHADIGLSRSPDGGVTWIPSATGSPWGNTFYNVVFDPDLPGRMYAAASSRHDIPNWTHISPNTPAHQGGVVVSDDFGKTWKVLGTGLPKLPCTWVCLDPRSPEGNRTLYAAMYEGGVYKSTDGGKTWVLKSQGLGNPGNLHVFMLQLHPVTGELFCSITANRLQEGNRATFPVVGGLWKSSDGAETWTDLTRDLKLHWPNSFAVHPTEPNTIYLTAATIPGGAEGGVYKTTDGGRTWQRLIKDEDFAKTGAPGYVHALYINLPPENPDRLYVGTVSHGLWYSPDAGKTWQRFTRFPFAPVCNVTFDPQDPGTIYVGTYGAGIWRGSSMP